MNKYVVLLMSLLAAGFVTAAANPEPAGQSTPSQQLDQARIEYQNANTQLRVAKTSNAPASEITRLENLVVEKRELYDIAAANASSSAAVSTAAAEGYAAGAAAGAQSGAAAGAAAGSSVAAAGLSTASMVALGTAATVGIAVAVKNKKDDKTKPISG